MQLNWPCIEMWFLVYFLFVSVTDDLLTAWVFDLYVMIDNFMLVHDKASTEFSELLTFAYFPSAYCLCLSQVIEKYRQIFFFILMSAADWFNWKHVSYLLCCFCANVAFGLVVMLFGASVQLTSSWVSTEMGDHSRYSA